jgi:integrase
MDMLRRLWDAADVLAAKPRRHAECYRALQLAIALPLRIGEIIKLRCRDVDVFARVIQLPSTITKTRKAFKLYLNDPARWVIRTQLAEVDAQLAKFGREREPQDLLFGAAKGGPLSRSSDTVEDLRIEAGLADYPFTAHTCRKAFQTRLREARLGLDGGHR